MTRRVTFVATIALAAAAVFALAVPATAHSALAGVDPAEGSTVAEGTVVTLSFNEDLLEIGTEIVVTDAAGVATALTPARPVPSQAAVTLPALAEGAVTLAWRVVSADGHPIEGVLGYVAAAPPAPSPSASASAGPSPSALASASPSVTPVASASPVPSGNQAGGDRQGLPVALWIAIGAAIAAAGAVSIATKSRR